MALKVSESEFCSANRTRNIPLSGRRYEMYACANAFAFRWDKHTGAKLSGLLLKPATARTKCVSRYTSEACRVFFCRVFFWVSRLAEEEPVEKEEDPTRPPLLALTATTWCSVARSAAKIPPPDDEVLPLVPRLKAPRHTDRNASRNAFRFVTENGKGAQHPSADPGHQVAAWHSLSNAASAPPVSEPSSFRASNFALFKSALSTALVNTNSSRFRSVLS
mmetsp:Transcript_11669/g.38736  ORF Transcript_11669/g.38736 Transcript_11669/m.38736 type:complete len:220 (+) Transcript_11669:1054-1713(+)